MSQISLQENDTKLDGIDTNANNYSHPTGAGNNHIPSGGSVGQILENTASGTVQWADATGSIFPAFANSTWTTGTFTSSGNTTSFTAPTGGNGIFFVGRAQFRSNNTSVMGSMSSSISGTGSYCMFGGDYGGYLTSGGSAGPSGAVAGNPINHGMQGFLAPGGSLNFNAAAPNYNMYFNISMRYKTV